MIAWSSFTPLSALAGGVLIGVAAALLLAFNGRIAGISGMLGGLLEGAEGKGERLAFIAGIVGAPLLWWVVQGEFPHSEVTHNTVLLVLAGVAVGLGTRYASGCTSGHGVCGLSRLSLRSLVATLSFMFTGFATVYVVRHLLGTV